MSESAPSSTMPVVQPEAVPLTPPLPEHVNPADQLPPIDYHNEEELKKRLRIQVVDVSEGVAANAADHADEYLNEQTTQRGFKGFIKRIWHGNIARDYVRQREVQRSRRDIVDSGNIYIAQGGSKEDHDREMSAVVQRFAGEYNLVRSSRGESNEDLSRDEAGQHLEGELKRLIGEFANGRMEEADLKEAKTRLLSDYGRAEAGNARKRNKGLLYADNIVEVAIHARAAASHGIAIDRIDSVLTARSGEALIGVRTKATETASDRIVNKLYETKLGSSVNETTVAVAAAAAISIGKFTTQKAVTAAGATVGMGVGAGLIAGAREHARIGQERRLHMRQMAEGQAVPIEGKKRQRLEETRYETVSASSLAASLRGTEAAMDISNPDSIKAALASIVDANSRIYISDRDSIDLVSFSDKMSVESERLDLDIALAKAKVELGKKLAGLSDDELSNLGLESRDVQELVGTRYEQVDQQIGESVEAKDRIFRKLRRNRTLKMAACGAVSSIVVGTAIQEAKAAFSDQLQGVFEHDTNHQTRRTVLAGLFRHGNHASEVGSGNTTQLADNASVQAPDGYHVTALQDGTSHLVDANGKTVTDLHFTPDGHLTDASKQALGEHGFNLHDSLQQYDQTKTVTQTVQRTPEEYLAAHQDQFTNVSRQIWYDNNTPHIYERNELGLHWGGVEGSGIDANGNYVFNINTMLANGSIHGANTANFQQLLHQGNLKIALSMTEGTQSHVFMVSIDPNGNAIIDGKSFMGQSLFENQNGHARFVGAFAEAVQVVGNRPDGTTAVNMLATLSGPGNPHAAADVITNTVTTHSERVLSELTAVDNSKLPVEIPFVLPVYGRRGLDPVLKGGPEGYGYGYGYGYNANQYWRHWSKERSPRLRYNPDSDLNTGEELAWYRQQQERARGKGYLQEIDGYIDENDSLKGISDETKAIVCIPVAAANEADNIYRTLSMFARQDDESKKQSLIMLNVNWKEALEGDPAKMEQINKTLAEIERAKADFPDLNIAYFKKVWSDAFVQSKQGKIYGEVIKVLYDTAALAMDKAVKDGRRKADSEAVLITNDADTLGMSRNYLRNYILNMERNPKADVFSATIRRGTESYKDFPGYGVASEFYALLNMVMQRQQKAGNGGFTTEGPNSGIRMSMYAGIGGVEERIGAGADAVLGQRIHAARTTPANKRTWRQVLKGERKGGSERVIGQYVGGAQVDTLPDRLLGAYRQGKWIARGWDQFDNGGYQGREESMAAGQLEHENPETDMDDIARRVETSVEGFASNWYRDPAVVSSALTLCFGANKEDRQLYTYEWDWSKPGDGAFKFSFTDEGKRELKNRLMRDRQGRYDSFGNRLSRQLYGRTNGGAKTPKLANPRLLS